MPIKSLVLSLFGRGVRRPRRPARFRPQVTALESRWLPSTITEFPLPPLTFNPIISTAGITAGPDGNVWFTEPATGVVGRITPAGQVTEFPTPVSNPGAITAGPDGNLWFTGGSLLNDPSIGRITPAGQVTKFDLPDRLGVPSGIAAGPDGNLWFTERIYLSGEVVGQITPAGQLTEFTIPGPASGAASSIGAITAGPDGNLWFVHDGILATITPAGALRDHVVDNLGDVALTTGPDGNLWAAGTVIDPQTGQTTSAFIDRISLTGSVTQFDLGSSDNIPASITAGPDGNLWFAQPSIDQIGRITPAGQITTFPVPTAFSEPTAIAAGPNGNLWFTEVKNRAIGEYFLVGTPPVAAAATTTTLAADVSAPAAGQTVHLTATVTSPAGTPTGTVTFFDAHSGALGTVSLDANGRAVLAAALTASGSHTLTAVFNGTAAFAPSQSPALRETVKRTSTRTTLTASANAAAAGQMLVMTATVKPAFAGAGAPRGTVVLKDGNKTIASATLDSSGRAVFRYIPEQVSRGGRSGTTLLRRQTLHLTVSFMGFGDFAASVSAPFDLTVV
jgi:virginiamycin B lyase